MANSIASPLLMGLSDRLSSIDGLTWGKLRLTLAEILALARGAEKHSDEDTVLEYWLSDVTSVAYAADDFLDECDLFVLRNNMEKKVINPFSHCNRIALRYKLELKLLKIESMLSELVQKFQQLDRTAAFRLKAAGDGVESSLDRRTVSLVHEDDVIGRVEDKEFLVHQLLENTFDYSDGPVKFLSIVGMGGIGKTTLAQVVYNDERVQRHFDLRVWVWVSEEFDLIRVVKEILEAATLHMPEQEHMDALGGTFGELFNLDALGGTLGELLHGKRFLIVLDDMWDVDDEKWLMLVRWFSMGAHGSKVVLTTRDERIAALVSNVRPYCVGHLSDEDSWSLFWCRAFSPYSQNEGVVDSNFEQIGMVIVAKCKGLPLAVKTLGSLMRFKRKESDWLSVLKEDLRQLPVFKSDVLPNLMLSYSHLPSHLKQCFAYCSVFPKGYTIRKDKLIRCWIANGLVRSTTKGKTMEEISNEYLTELLEKSFLTDVGTDEHGQKAECQMHDLIHDLALCVAGRWCSVLETEAFQNISSELHHSSLVLKYPPFTIPDVLYQAKNLRTLLFLSGKYQSIATVFQVFKHLRVLDLSKTGLRVLPVSVGEMIHLRYLDVSHTYIETLPRSICKLKSLQAMELSECHSLQELPKSISRLVNLRHLSVQSCSLLSHMPVGIGKLKLLQTLPTFILGKADDCGRLSDLSELNLKGGLEIENLEHVRNLAEARDLKLSKKRGLYSLRLSWSQNLDAQMCVEVLQSLRPPGNVEVLDIRGYGYSTGPSWLGDSNLTLVKLSLISCSFHALPPLGQLPNLRDLHMKGLSEILVIGHEFYGDHIIRGFPSLKQLELYDMPNLVEWRNFMPREHINLIEMEELVAFSCLDTLSIKGCNKLTNLPLLPHLRKLAISNCNMMLLGSVDHLTSLSSLVIDGYREPMLFSKYLRRLNSIKTLTMYNCDHLMCLIEEDMKVFSSLEHLRILCCDKLKSLPRGLMYPTSLRKLEIVDCQDLVNIPDIKPYLPSFQELIIKGCPNLVSWPDATERKEEDQKGTSSGTHASLGLSFKQTFPNVRDFQDISEEILAIPKSGVEKLSPNLKAFPFNELKNATESFHPNYLLSEGGGSCLYRGWIHEYTLTDGKVGLGMVVVIKKLLQVQKEWLAKINYLGQLHHPNVVKLIGYCADSGNSLLVYEFMSRGSLENYLFGRAQSLPWPMRIKVAIDAARGLSYVHDAEVPIVPRDLKSANILLDADFNAKVSIFGLDVVWVTGDGTQSTNGVTGTLGYLAPEYISTGQFSDKCDVYSFGVVLLELLSGRRAIELTKDEPMIVAWAKPFLDSKENVQLIMDSKLEGSYSTEAASAVAAIAWKCLNNDPLVRPRMSEVVKILEQPSVRYTGSSLRQGR